MSDIKHYSHDNLPGGLKRDTFVADGNVLAPKLEALDEYLHELCDGPVEAMVLLSSLLDIYKQVGGIAHITTSENPPQ